MSEKVAFRITGEIKLRPRRRRFGGGRERYLESNMEKMIRFFLMFKKESHTHTH